MGEGIASQKLLRDSGKVNFCREASRCLAGPSGSAIGRGSGWPTKFKGLRAIDNALVPVIVLSVSLTQSLVPITDPPSPFLQLKTCLTHLWTLPGLSPCFAHVIRAHNVETMKKLEAWAFGENP